jgi:hypothetical protein
VSGRARALVWPVLVVAGALAPLLPGLLPGKTLAWRDSAALHRPVRTLVVEALREGRLPLWNPWEGGGQPLLAQALHAAVHPVSIAAAAVSDSIDLFLASLVVVAALGAWVAARLLGSASATAAVAAFGYGLSGYVLGMTSNALYLAGAATLPWAIAGMQHAARSPTGWFAACAGVAALGLAGDPGALVAGLVIGLAMAAERGGAKGLAAAGSGAMLGVAGAAIQLVPTWIYLDSTLRGTGLGPAVANQWSLDLARLPEIFSPGLFVGLPRSFRAPVFEAFGSPADVPFPWSPSVFLGAPVLILAVAGTGSSRSSRLLVLLALAFLWVAMGEHAGAAQLLGGLPVWGALRFWEKMMAPLSLCLALAAAAGTEALVEGRGPLVGRWASMVAAAVGAASVVTWLLPHDPDTAAGLFRVRLAGGLAFSAISLLFLAAAARAARRRPARGGAAVAAVVLLQSLAASPFALHYGSMDALRQRPPLLQAGAPGPRLLNPLQRNVEIGNGEQDAIDVTHAFQYRTGRPATNVASRVETVEAYTGFGTVRSAVVAGAGPLRWPLLRRLGATHLVSQEPQDEGDRVLLGAAAGPGPTGPARTSDGIFTWELVHRPWASFASSVRAAGGVRAAALALGEEIAAGRDTVVVEAPSEPATAPGVVVSVERRAERIAVEAESADPALLVVNDAFAPGWTASIDGSPTEILAADVLVRAVQWPPGRHLLVMRYEPPEVAMGAALSGGAGAIALAILLLQRRRRNAS